MKYVLTSSPDFKKIYFFLLLFLSHLFSYYRDTCPWPIISKLFQSKTSMILKSHEAPRTFWWKNLWTNEILSVTLFFFSIKNVPMLFTSLHFAWSNYYALLCINCKKNTNILLSNCFLTELLRENILNCFRYEFILTCLFKCISILYS